MYKIKALKSKSNIYNPPGGFNKELFSLAREFFWPFSRFYQYLNYNSYKTTITNILPAQKNRILKQSEFCYHLLLDLPYFMIDFTFLLESFSSLRDSRVIHLKKLAHIS
jgi:hypothetical protein